MVPMMLMLMLMLMLAFCSLNATYTIEDVFIPDNCDSIAKPTDHVLIEYEVLFQNGSTGLSSKKPEQLFHFVVESTEAVPLQKSLKGMCTNSTRKIIWQYAGDINLSPVMRGESALSKLDESISFQITVNHITTQEDYQIFDALKMNNISKVIDMIDEHKGVNAVDEWGYTPLMLAVSRSNLPVIATLLNTRRPTVDVNLAKPSGFTALFYAVEHAPPTIVQALLRRGADPNVFALQEDSYGNTPLHYACLLEKTKQAELLLEYGANPMAKNKYGQTPLQVLPSNAVMSMKLYLKKIFEDAKKKWESGLPGPNNGQATAAMRPEL